MFACLFAVLLETGNITLLFKRNCDCLPFHTIVVLYSRLTHSTFGEKIKVLAYQKFFPQKIIV